MNIIHFQSSEIFERVLLGITIFGTDYCFPKFTKKMSLDNVTTKAEFQKFEDPFLKLV